MPPPLRTPTPLPIIWYPQIKEIPDTGNTRENRGETLTSFWQPGLATGIPPAQMMNPPTPYYGHREGGVGVGPRQRSFYDGRPPHAPGWQRALSIHCSGTPTQGHRKKEPPTHAIPLRGGTLANIWTRRVHFTPPILIARTRGEALLLHIHWGGYILM